jgi:hypothetical protein
VSVLGVVLIIRTNAGKLNLKPRTLAANQEIVDLYWKPALGHLRLVDVRDHHVAEAVREMMKINRPLPMAGGPRRCCAGCSPPAPTMSGAS